MDYIISYLICLKPKKVTSWYSIRSGSNGVPVFPLQRRKVRCSGNYGNTAHEMARDGDAKLGVSVLCPGVVRTNIATAQRNRPDHLRRQRNEVGNVSAKAPEEARSRNAAIASALENGMDPEEVAGKVVSAMYEERFWILSHPVLDGSSPQPATSESENHTDLQLY